MAVGNTEVTNTVYDVTCHKHCTLKGLPTETVNDPRLATCTAFEFDTDTAKSKFFGRKVTEFPGYGQSACKFVDCGEWECDYEALLSTLTPKKRQEYEDFKRARFREDCWNCGHSFKQHMHITYTTKVVEKEFLSEKVQANLNSIKDEKQKKDAIKMELTNNIKELEKEKECIMGCATNF